MRVILLVSLLTVFFFLTTCKKDGDNPQGEISLLDGLEAVNSGRTKLKEYLDQTSGDVIAATEQTAAWLSEQSKVDTAIAMEGVYIFIYLKSGLKTGICLYPTDAQGYSIFRGGGGGNQLRQLAGGGCTNSMSNTNVLIYAAAYNEFYKPGEMDRVVNILNSSDTDFELTLLKNEQCTPDVVAAFKDYGLVILDTHGEPEGFMTGIKFSFSKKPESEEEVRETIINQTGADIFNKLINGNYAQYSHLYFNDNTSNWWNSLDTAQYYHVWMNSEYLTNWIPDMPNTIVFGNMCNSGWLTAQPDNGIKNPIGIAFQSKNPISYYGYTRADGTSRSVTDIFAKRFEDSLVASLAIDYDSTGIAHLKPNLTEMEDTMIRPYITTRLFFKQYRDKTYCYGCPSKLTDARDGQTYDVVCIGNQTWMAENLNYNTPGSYCYSNNTGNCATYGRLYEWNTAMNGASATNQNPSGVQGVCPAGWHVPSFSEWLELMTYVGVQTAGGSLKATTLWNSPNTGATDSFGFSALPGGNRDTLGNFNQLGNYAQFWTASDSAQINKKRFFVLAYNNAIAGFSTISEKYSMAVRCVKD